MKNDIRYRARMEWSGIELFDRFSGAVVKPDESEREALSGLLRQLLLKGIPDEAGIKASHINSLCEQKLLAKYPVIENGSLNVEPLINTPYSKSPDYASAPRRIYFELTRRCNLNCRSCFNRSFSDKSEMTFTEIEKTARSLYDSGVYEIRCTGGEPTRRKDFFEILAMLSGMGFYISIGTNGVYAPDTMRKMLTTPVDFFILSLDGGDESQNDIVRGSGSFLKSMETLEQIASKGCRIRINTLIRNNHFTYEDIKKVAQIADRYHAESVNCIPLRPVTNDPEMLKLQLSPVQFKEFIDGLNRLRNEFKTDFVTTLDLRHTSSHDRIFKKDKSCAAGREGAVISPYGEIYGCSYSPASSHEIAWEQRKRYVAGNVLEEDILKIWNDSGRWAIYRDLDRFKNPACKICSYYLEQRCIGNCPIMDRNDPAAFDPYCYLHADP